MDNPFRRIFIALPVNDDVIIQSLSSVVDNLTKYRSILKIVSPINYHITVKFFGQVESNIVESLTESFLSLTQLNMVNYNIDKISAFSTKGNPSVIWAGLKCSEEPLINIINSINELSLLFKFPVEKRKFIPHLTLARIKNNEKVPLELKNYLNSNIELKSFSSVFNELILFESILKKTGPEYKKLGVINLI
ncbi:MAG: RNA 2',3'-cyclic phosphodiesterase [Spirochaetes bacterium]|nr:RNA 2',3'-cyclic phosphodiesterase [Spirochaetota bacterium]